MYIYIYTHTHIHIYMSLFYSIAYNVIKIMFHSGERRKKIYLDSKWVSQEMFLMS